MIWAILGILIMIPALFIIPLGLPGLWIMVAVLAAGALAGEVGLAPLATAVALAVAAELAEFLFVADERPLRRLARRVLGRARAGSSASSSARRSP